MVKPRQSGFSLTELVIVVAVILVILAITVPRLLSARMSANAASAAVSIRALHTAETTYASNYPAIGYSASLINLGRNGSTCETVTSTNACLIDDTLASGIKSGYVFDITGDGFTPDTAYSVTAAPVSNGYSGQCSFSSDQSGAIHGQANTSHTSILQMGGGASGCELGGM
ncbi:MAG TPA: prepilin-type N-terminal cleavage/methylation domain-containing protein [Candidatus Angelobacter sp.]|jgi:prepilin-type N-terminal cleavage/methylation domain-containing protein|nr:prepilin-type N-terminal cleavage/methylation domain-containing protein [Candidatus Angelobacter sp.]